MNAKTNEQTLAALQDVVGMALKNWLNENKAEVLEALRAAHPARQDPPQVKRAVPEQEKAQEFLGTAEVAARWQLHRESVRRMVRQGRLPRMSVGGRILVPMTAITECEKEGRVPSRR